MSNTAPAQVEFHGASLLTTIINNVAHVALKVISDALGLDWSGQLQRIKRHAVLSTSVVVTPMQMPGDDQTRDVVLIRLDKLNGWLFGISAGRVKPELRERLVQYQAECFDVLAQHFGAAPAIPYAILPGQTLTDEQANTLRQILTKAADKAPKEKQGQLVMQGWSKLKAHFKVGYREIPQSEFSEAVSLLTRHVVDWELADAKPALPLQPIRTLLTFDPSTGQTTMDQLTPAHKVLTVPGMVQAIQLGFFTEAEVNELAFAVSMKFFSNTADSWQSDEVDRVNDWINKGGLSTRDLHKLAVTSSMKLWREVGTKAGKFAARELSA